MKITVSSNDNEQLVKASQKYFEQGYKMNNIPMRVEERHELKYFKLKFFKFEKLIKISSKKMHIYSIEMEK